MNDADGQLPNRRLFLQFGLTSGLAIAMAGIVGAVEPDKKQDEVAPPEDLMREHGLLKRVLLIYAEVETRIGSREDFPMVALADAAGIIRNFIEDYHEKLEEDFLFPRFRKARKLADLVQVLQEQHQVGRRLTDVTKRLAVSASLRNDSERAQLSSSLHQFIRMYEPHEAREDTILFPALREIVTPHEFGALGEDFEKKEHELFGEDGFEKMVDRVANIEKQLGIYELSQFTPKI